MKFKSHFDQLEYSSEVRTNTDEALMHVFEDYGPQCYVVQPQRAFLENNNDIIFTDEDIEMAFPDHRMPLYLGGQINDVFIGRTLVDTGSSVNILPLAVLTTAGIPTSKMARSQISINEFGNSSEETIGYIKIDLKISPIRLGGSNHIVWKNPEYGGVAHQASKIPQETEDTHVPVVEDESLHKIMPMPKNISRKGEHHLKSHAPNKCKGAEKLDEEAVIHLTLHPRISSNNRSFAPLLKKMKEFIRNALATFGSKLTFVKEKLNIAVIRRKPPTIDAPFLEEAPEGDDWRETVRIEFSKPNKELNVKCLKEYINVTGTFYKCLSG
ncbi:hypothetical protein D8674_031469 [Pyrus ussuriensis x Pyrus communis]|uniref:Uncharacterized protein n=1 Tax=Pyrus ussuriensis x Pyrus communis TaxID=2448454 RepID=A0A5N5EYN8_9ROSA|nr:hypothetical protein D8674_031469 [Pyrus ussuriensis x Pyrus communis]